MVVHLRVVHCIEQGTCSEDFVCRACGGVVVVGGGGAGGGTLLLRDFYRQVFRYAFLFLLIL